MTGARILPGELSATPFWVTIAIHSDLVISESDRVMCIACQSRDNHGLTSLTACRVETLAEWSERARA